MIEGRKQPWTHKRGWLGLTQGLVKEERLEIPLGYTHKKKLRVLEGDKRKLIRIVEGEEGKMTAGYRRR